MPFLTGIPTFVRSRSGLGLVIVTLLLAQMFLFGATTCPVRPDRGTSARDSAAKTAAVVLGHDSSAPTAAAFAR